MDFNPLIPNATNYHDVAHILSESFEDTIKGYIFPSNVAENIRKNNVDEDYELFKQYGHEVKQLTDCTAEEHVDLRTVEAKMMEKQAQYMILEKSIEDNSYMKEHILLKRDGLFQSYPFSIEKHNLIDKKDILPTIVEQSIDFVFRKDLHNCKFKHIEKTEKCIENELKTIPRIELESCGIHTPTHYEDIAEPLKLIPSKIVFENFDINILYKKRFRLQNCSSRKRPFFYKYPRKSPFVLKPLSNTNYLAPGMYIDFIITYYTAIYHNYNIDIKFSTSGGFKTTLNIKSFRKPPHLRVYIFRSMEHVIQTKCPGTPEFWERRCTALNDTIDCGHCFIGNYNYLSLIIGNIGSVGHFFCLSEDEWISGDVSNIDHTMQFAKDCFKIFPTYISIEQDEVAEICVTFTPDSPGLHVEKLYLISDNNTAKTVEILGDGLHFSKNMFQVTLKPNQYENIKQMFLYDKEDEELSSRHCVFLGPIANLSTNNLTLNVNNKSALYLNFYWILRENESKNKTVNHLNPDCVSIKNIHHNYLAPYTMYDFDVDVLPEVEKPGYYTIFLGLFIEKVPELALMEGEEFIVSNPVEIEHNKYVDIQICEIEIACEIFFAEEENEESEIFEDMDCPQPPLHEPMVGFSSSLIDFGVIPIGLEIERKFQIHRLTKKNVAWRLVEIIYDVDARPPMYIASQPSVNISSGVLDKNIFGLKYRVNAKVPKRRVSMLLLFTGERTEEIKMNAMCLVTYEVINWDIRIFSKVSNLPVVCSMKLHFVGVKSKWCFFIKNYTPIMGCFWLLPPRGEEVDKLELTFHPKFGMIRPGEKVIIEVTVLPKDIGIIEKIFVPCFISKHSPPIMIRFLCVVEDLNVYFYIPNQEQGFDKIMWPPKVLNEVDFQQLKSTDIPWPEEEHKDLYSFEIKSDYQDMAEGNETDIKTDSYTIDNANNTISTMTSSTSQINSLRTFLKEKWQSEFIPQDYIVEIKNVSLRKPQQFSFYIENFTPIKADFTVETINFEPCLDKRSKYLNALTMIYPDTALKSWDEACGKQGIVLICDTGKGNLKNDEVIQLTVWLYATTWGIYTEEIVVNINDIVPFYFTVIIEVNGAPIEFPIARNTIRSYPTLRFGDIPYMSEIATQNLHFKNTSCVPINIQWLLFDTTKKESEGGPFNAVLDIVNKQFRTSDEEIKLFLSDKWYGNEDVKFMQVHPRNVEIEPGEICSAKIKIDPNFFPVDFGKVNIACNLIGYIFVKQEHKNQPNLVFRRSADDLKPLHVEILATITMPLLKLDMLGGNSKICLYATKIIDGTSEGKLIKLILKNNNLTTVFVTFHVELPFFISNISQRDYEYRKNINNAKIKPGDIVEIKIECLLQADYINEMGKWVYGKEPPKKEAIFTNNKMIQLHRHLNIHQQGVLEQSLPIFCEIYYPQIETIPKFLKFGYVKIGMTKKLMLHLYNRTNIDIEFEIKKSTNSVLFEVKPLSGVIPKAVGLTRSFVDIYVYFKPTLYDFFQESISIDTKIPNCSLGVPFNGYGIQNEKFCVDNLHYQH
ncbi:hypothetical protein WA026_016090 [Henosepilachna vigintioctopunctata]|uniref:Uncharacterized protein n=1 Tax=Henosepilachna vigintioctopunctata TaxID=420089 RepID=A0AAW1UCS9_9CUCU